MDENPINDSAHARRRVEREATRLRQKQRAAIVSVLATLAAALGAMLSSILAIVGSEDRTGDLLAALRDNQPHAERQLIEQQKDIDQIHLEVQKALARAPSGSNTPPSPAEVTALIKRLDLIEAEQKRLSVVITDTPEKAMTIPLMRRDIDEMKGSQTQVADALKREIDRVYDLNKWIIGGLAVGVLGLIVRDLFRGKRERLDG